MNWSNDFVKSTRKRDTERVKEKYNGVKKNCGPKDGTRMKEFKGNAT